MVVSLCVVYLCACVLSDKTKQHEEKEKEEKERTVALTGKAEAVQLSSTHTHSLSPPVRVCVSFSHTLLSLVVFFPFLPFVYQPSKKIMMMRKKGNKRF